MTSTVHMPTAVKCCHAYLRRCWTHKQSLSPTTTGKMRSLTSLIVAANVLSALAVPTNPGANTDNTIFGSAKALLAQVDALTGNVGAGVLGAVEAAVEHAWNSHSEKEQRARSSVVETNGVSCECHLQKRISMLT